ncbi:MAG: hypothetical protein NTW96_03600 [Planctomycetia bacterium]|nr:hypothetical protein [Planctomycetia bacterium]
MAYFLAASAALTAGAKGALIGGAGATVAAMLIPAIPYGCAAAQVMGAAGVVVGAASAYQSFHDGHYYTAAFEAGTSALAVFGVARGLFAKASRLAGGTCFVAGTEVVVSLSPWIAAAANATTARRDSDDADAPWSTASMTVGVGLVAAGAAGLAHERRRREEEQRREGRRLFFARASDDDLDDDGFEPLDDAASDATRSTSCATPCSTAAPQP